MQMALCHGPADACYKIRVGDKVAFRGVAPGGPITISKSRLFGGEDREGGISGTLDLEMGEPTQDQNDYLVSKLGAAVPAFRGVVTAVLRRMYIGTTPYIKPWAFTLQRIFLRSDGTEQWYPAKAAVPSEHIAEDEPGLELASGDTMNAEGQVDTNGDYAVWSESNTVKVWHLPDGGLDTVTLTGSIAGGGRVHITDSEDLVVMSGGNLGASIPCFLEFRRISDPDTILQSFNLGNILNWGFVMGERQGHALVKIGPISTETNPWYLLSRGESGWSLDDTQVGASHPGSAFVETISMGPTYAYCRLVNSTSVIRVTWNGTWAETLVDLSASIPGNIKAIAYVNGEVAVTAGTGIFVFSEELSTLHRSSTSFPAQFGIPVHSKRMATNAGTVIVADSGSSGNVIKHVYQIKVSDLEVVSDLDIAASNYVRKGIAFTYFLYNAQHGTAFIGGHFTNTVLWPIFAIGQDMNPAHIIRECLTDRNWGMGYNESDIDDVSFTGAADAFYAEAFGLSMLWQREEEIGEFINTVLSHVDAFLYTSRETGKFVLKPIRADYDIDTIPVVDEDDVVEWDEVSRRQPAEVVNSVIVTYHDRAKAKDASRAVHNIAQIQETGELISTTRHYPGITGANLAVRVGTRDVKALGAGMASGRITCKRTVESLNPGDPFRLVSSRHDLSGEVMRVGELTFGDGRKNAIGLKFAQDVFSLGEEILVDGGESPWENPASEPAVVTPRLVWEMPYREMVQMVGTDADALLTTDADAGLLQVAGAQPSEDTLYATISIDAGSGYEDAADTLDFFAPHALLGAALERGDTSVDVTDDVDLDQVVIGTLAVIGAEIVRIDAISGQTLTLGRGCLDTVPAEHASGASIIFFDDFSMSDFEARTDADVLGVKLLPVTGQGGLELVDAPADTVTFDGRAIRPYVPKGVTVATDPGYTGPVDVSGSDPFTVSWARPPGRLVLDNLQDWTVADVTPESGATVTVDVLDIDENVLETYSGISGTSQAIPHADFAGEDAGIIRVYSVRDGYRSWQHYDITVVAVSLVISGTSVLTTTVGEVYAGFTVTADGGIEPYTFSLVGDWPDGITIDPDTGAVGGTPTESGTFTGLSVRVTDSSDPPGTADLVSFTLEVEEPVATDPHFANVVLLVGFDGTDGATTAVDDSPAGHSPFTFLGNAQIDTAQSKFGGGSLLLDGTGDYVALPDSDDWNVGSAAFTIETWVRFNSLATANAILSQSGGTSGSRGFILDLSSSGVLKFGWRSTVPSNPELPSSSGVMTTGQWYHVAVDRSGNTLRLYVNGTMVAKDTGWTTTQANIAETFRFGAQGAAGNALNGWLDEVRITKGVARYASDAGYTVPAAAFPRS
ncbi:hypothetical protein D8676_25385 [Mesorhizobium sp. YM1C-6-2]|nr:hypothetical protein D8676_25385 [Mesorhizobium sp. YM1C-6-2]